MMMPASTDHHHVRPDRRTKARRTKPPTNQSKETCQLASTLTFFGCARTRACVRVPIRVRSVTKRHEVISILYHHGLPENLATVPGLGKPRWHYRSLRRPQKSGHDAAELNQPADRRKAMAGRKANFSLSRNAACLRTWGGGRDYSRTSLDALAKLAKEP